MAELWQEVGHVSEWGDPDRIEENLRQFVVADTATSQEMGGVKAQSYHKLGLGIAVRVAVAGANVAKAATLAALGETAESLSSSGTSDLAQRLAFHEAQEARFDLGSLRRNWEVVRRAVLTMVPGVDATALCARIREEGMRPDLAAGPSDAGGKDQLCGRPRTENSSEKSSTSDLGAAGGAPEAGPAETPPGWFAGASLCLEGGAIDVQLRVQLPFWLLMPDCELTAKFRESSLKVSVSGKTVEIRAGWLPAAGCFHFAPRAREPWEAAAEPVPGVSGDAPGARPAPKVNRIVVPDGGGDIVFRSTRTVLTIRTKAIEDCVRAITDGGSRTLDASMYFQSLAHAHIPFVNSVINAYRRATGDPFAVEVTEWDVPTWFLSVGGRAFAIPLVPYAAMDRFPTVERANATAAEPVHLSTEAEVQSALGSGEFPGEIDLLDAWALYFRGRFADAVRSLMTAIEVALEFKLREALSSKGLPEQEVERRLSKTFNDFDARLTDYSRTMRRRVPGPIVSALPWLNGVRLKRELMGARRLRHKVVHEGLQLDPSMYAHLQRPMETMTWLFNWLVRPSAGPFSSRIREYPMLVTMRGDAALFADGRFAHVYAADGVVPRRPPVGPISEMPAADVVIFDGTSRAMLLEAMDGETVDVEAFSFTSLSRLGFRLAESPMPSAGSPFLHERCLIASPGRTTVVFIVDTSELVGRAAIEQVATRVLALEQAGGVFASVLCVVNHQNGLQWQLREVEGAFAEDAESVALSCGITVVTAVDLLLLTIGAEEFGWDLGEIRKSLQRPGRQATSPPGCRKLGTVHHFFEHPQVLSVAVDQSARVRVGDTVIIRLRDRYHQQAVESLQVNRIAVPEALGQVLAGIQTSLHRGDVPIGAPVFVIAGETKESATGAGEANGACAGEKPGDSPVAGT
jgi:hypothetical protein